jgi:hypothetical protein
VLAPQAASGACKRREGLLPARDAIRLDRHQRRDRPPMRACARTKDELYSFSQWLQDTCCDRVARGLVFPAPRCRSRSTGPIHQINAAMPRLLRASTAIPSTPTRPRPEKIHGDSHR